MDNDSLDARVIAALRSRGMDVLTTNECGNERLPDDEQLRLPTREGRAVHSANIGDFMQLHALWVRTNQRHAAIILRSHQRMSVGDQIRGPGLLGETSDTASFENSIEFLDAWVRRAGRP